MLEILDYFQPSFYHFSQDSIEFVHWLRAHLKLQNTGCHLLDLCAGCGVIGLELLQSFPELDVTFCDLQSDFLFYFKENARQYIKKDLEHCFYVQDLKAFNLTQIEKFDYIVCNPPYFSPRQGKISQNYKKKTCRFFGQEDWEQLLSCFERSLAVDGKAFFLSREIHWSSKYNVELVGSLTAAKIFCFELNKK